VVQIPNAASGSGQRFLQLTDTKLSRIWPSADGIGTEPETSGKISPRNAVAQPVS